MLRQKQDGTGELPFPYTHEVSRRAKQGGFPRFTRFRHGFLRCCLKFVVHPYIVTISLCK